MNDIGPVAVQFLPRSHRKLVETSIHIQAPNVWSFLCFLLSDFLSGTMNHVLCGGETNQRKAHGFVCFVPACTVTQTSINQVRLYRLQTCAAPHECVLKFSGDGSTQEKTNQGQGSIWCFQPFTPNNVPAD